jgi:peptidoglycan/LPS O-acetylase OafA/YrhL
MANKPANAGSSGGQAPVSATGITPAPRSAAGHRAAEPKIRRTRATPPEPSVLAWVPYLVVLAGVGAGVLLAAHASWDADRGAGLVGCSLLAGALARLVLPARLGSMLSTRGKASDVLAFTVLGAGVLALALLLP